MVFEENEPVCSGYLENGKKNLKQRAELFLSGDEGLSEGAGPGGLSSVVAQDVFSGDAGSGLASYLCLLILGWPWYLS